MKRKAGNARQIKELLYQALETEIGGLAIYETAVSCAINEDLKKEWLGYLEETRTHRRVLLTVFEQLKLDPQAKSLGEYLRAKHADLPSSLLEALP